VKLLLDENLSRFLVRRLEDLFPSSTHVANAGLESSSDQVIWDYAVNNGFVIVSKDSDFHQRSFLFGAPPKVIWINAGNLSTSAIENLIRSHADAVVSFIEDNDSTFLVLGKKS
jgi:predicted nuclease of predicted toxin-antitoxin system